MYNSGDAAEQVVRISLEGTEVALKLTGSAAKKIAAMLYAVWKNRDKNKTKGHQRLSSIFQQYYLLPDMTVDKNVRMGADLAGNADYREIIKAVGLEAKAAKYPSELSGGEQQRVSVARALAKKPKVLFLDEPTGALDEKTGRQVLDYICKLHTEYGFTIVMVTHNANIAEMANTVIRMNSGEIAEIYANAVQKSAYEIGW